MVITLRYGTKEMPNESMALSFLSTGCGRIMGFINGMLWNGRGDLPPKVLHSSIAFHSRSLNPPNRGAAALEGSENGRVPAVCSQSTEQAVPSLGGTEMGSLLAGDDSAVAKKGFQEIVVRIHEWHVDFRIARKVPGGSC